MGAAVAGGDDDDAFDLAAKEVAGGFGLGVGALVGGGEEDGVGVLLGDGADGVRAGGEEGVVEIGDDDADGVRAVAAKGAGHKVGLVLEVFESAGDAGAGLIGDARSAVEHAGDGHHADAGAVGDVAHAGGALSGSGVTFG